MFTSGRETAVHSASRKKVARTLRWNEEGLLNEVNGPERAVVPEHTGVDVASLGAAICGQ